MSIKIECEGSGLIDIDDIQPLQGNLKSLSKESYIKLRKEILNEGFSAPFFIWKNKILDGHQRHRVLQKMRAEGIAIPKLPYVKIEAKNEKQAKQKLLAFASQYGEMEAHGLYEFLNEAGIDFDEAKNSYRFPEVDFKKFDEAFYSDSTNKDEGNSLSDIVQFIVTIKCRDENQMQELYEEFKERGLECKLIT